MFYHSFSFLYIVGLAQPRSERKDFPFLPPHPSPLYLLGLWPPPPIPPPPPPPARPCRGQALLTDSHLGSSLGESCPSHEPLPFLWLFPSRLIF